MYLSPEILNTVGLTLDIVGVWLIASELLRRSKPERELILGDEKLHEGHLKKFHLERCLALLGLVALTFGFGFHILAAWLPVG